MYDNDANEVIDNLMYSDYRFVPKDERQKGFDIGVQYAREIDQLSDDEYEKGVEFYSMIDYLTKNYG